MSDELVHVSVDLTGIISFEGRILITNAPDSRMGMHIISPSNSLVLNPGDTLTLDSDCKQPTVNGEPLQFGEDGAAVV